MTNILVYASHIGGGTISVINQGANQYSIEVRLYRSEMNPILLPLSLDLGIYQKGTNDTLMILNLPLSSTLSIDLDTCHIPTNKIVIQEGLYQSTSTITIPDYALGYYFQTNFNLRIEGIQNLLDSHFQSLLLYAEIEDPALGANSTPTFSSTPLDSYFCINTPNTRVVTATDADGDSIAYSLVPSLAQTSSVTGTFSGSGTYPYYDEAIWESGYSISNIVGGSSPMTIDPVTGVFTAAPDIQGLFSFVLRAEDYRNGQKMGETRLDLLYYAINCTLGLHADVIDSVGYKCVNDTAFDIITTQSGGTWSGNGIVNSTNGTFDPLTSGGGNHLVTYSFTNTCDYFDTVTVNVHENNASFSYTNQGNGTYSFTNTSMGTFDISRWDFGDGNSSDQLNETHTFAANGTYTVVLTVADSVGYGSNNCSDFYTDVLNVTGVTSALACNAGFVTYPDTTSSNITVYNSSVGSNLSYFWDFGDSTTSSLQLPTHQYATNGNYLLCLTIDDGNGCLDTFCDSIGPNGPVVKQSGFAINVVSPISLSSELFNSNYNKINIFPNPSYGLVFLDSKDINISKLEYWVLDLSGRVVYTGKGIPNNQIDLTSLKNGTYSLVLRTDIGSIIKRFVILR